MARIDNESDSEGETSSEEELNASIEVAFKSVKKHLHKSGVNQNESRKNEEMIHEIHKKIYDSFDTDSEAELEVHKESEKETSSIKVQSTTSFIIDKKGSNTSNVDTEELQTEVFNIDLSGFIESDHEAHKGEEAEEYKKTKKNSDGKQSKMKDKNKLSSELEAGLNTKDLYVVVDPLKALKQKKKKTKIVQKEKKIEEPEIMKKCVLTEDYEKQVTIPTPKSKLAEKKERRVEREKTKGTKWFNMPAQEVTEERKNDFLVYQMRKSLDPKRFYRANDAVGIPKYYQFGTVVEHSSDFYDSRIPKKQRKANMVEELLADAKFRQYNKRRYAAIQEAKRLGTGPYDDMKKLKRRKKAK